MKANRKFGDHGIEDVSVFDTTLRDGEQTPGTTFSLEEKLRIAEKLDELGVDVIEAGFPINSEEEQEAVQKIADAVNTKVCGLARVEEKDIDAALETDVDTVHTFVSASDLQIEKSLDSTRDEVLEKTRNAVEKIAEEDVKCMFSPMDATRADYEYLVKIIREAKEAGADIVNIPDTVGVARPTMMKRLISNLRDEVEVPYDVHTHDDFGLAVANSLAGLEAGAVQAQVSVNGIGERAGNAALEELVMSLESIYNVDTGMNTEKIFELSKMVERLSEVPLPGNKPIVGDNAFSHESGIHAAGVIEDSETFEPGIMTPEMVGHRRKLVIGKHTGTHSVREVLEDAGYEPSEQEVKEITKKVKSMAGKGKNVTDTDLFTVAESVMSHVPESERKVKLEEANVLSGKNTTPTASITAEVDGKEKKGAATGVGPVDAAMKATTGILGGRNIDINKFHIDAINGGSDATGNVEVQVQDEEGRTSTAQASNDDITVASIESLVNAINHLERKKDE